MPHWWKMKPSSKRLLSVAWVSAIAVYLVWSIAFIVRSSFHTFSGNRFFCLFDDAMISMRYAHNLGNHAGLVWNAGEFVEGYTNLLYTLIMAVPQLFLNANYSCLFIQTLGIVWVLLSATLASRIVAAITDNRFLPQMRLVAFIATLLLYPLSYWSLMGMETGLYAVLILLSVWIAVRDRLDFSLSKALRVGTVLSLSYINRPDALIYVFAVGAYLVSLWRLTAPGDQSRKKLVVFCATIIAMVASTAALQTGFRWWYYHAMFPNTYTLKLGGFPILYRLKGGILFVKPFIACYSPLAFLAVLGIVLNISRERMLLIGCCGISFLYQVFVGGDPWPYWRMMVPVLPLLLVLALDTIKRMTLENFDRSFRRMSSSVFGSRAATLFAATGILAVCLTLANYPFIDEQLLLKPPFNRESNRINVDVARLLDTILTGDATIGVFTAGAVPYFTNRYAVDFLGKCDTFIASRNPTLSGQWGLVPGHNKHRLAYSIVDKKPTFIQGDKWDNDDVSDWVSAEYAKVRLYGYLFILKKNSPQVKWNLIKALGGVSSNPADSGITGTMLPRGSDREGVPDAHI